MDQSNADLANFDSMNQGDETTAKAKAERFKEEANKHFKGIMSVFTFSV